MKKNRNASQISATPGAAPSRRKGNVTEIVTSNNQIRVTCGAIDDSIVFDIQGSKLRMSSRPERKQQYQPPPNIEDLGYHDQKILVKSSESTMNQLKHQQRCPDYMQRLSPVEREMFRNSQSFQHQQTPQKPQTTRNFSYMSGQGKQSFIDRQVKEKSFLPSPCKYSHQGHWGGEKQASNRFKYNQTAEKRPKQKINYENGPAGKYAVVESWRSVLQVKDRDFSVNDDLNDFIVKP